MIADRNFGNTAPLGWVGSFPIYASTALAGAHALTMIATALAMAAGAEWLIQMFQFSSTAVRGQLAVWQLVTYAFVHPPSLFFLLEIYMLVIFGQEIEKFLGRQAFLAIYLTLVLLPPLVLTLAAFAGISSLYWGSGAVNFGVLIAFATLYPTTEIFFGIQARWIAMCFLAVSGLQALASSNSMELAALTLDCCAGFFLVRYLRSGELFPKWRSCLPGRPTAHLRILKRPEATPVAIDVILEKISRSGMASLTSQERARLHQVREELLEVERNR